MKALLSNRFLIIAFVGAAVLIPLNMIAGLVEERQGYHAQAVADMEKSSAGPQRLVGPVLYLPCDMTSENVYDSSGFISRLRDQSDSDCSLPVPPDRLEITGTLRDDVRRRGIHEAVFYIAKLSISARFTVPPMVDKFGTPIALAARPASVNLGVFDPRGIVDVPTVEYGGRERQFVPDTLIPALGTGMHANLGTLRAGETIDLDFEIELRGLERFDVVPIGPRTTMRLRSDWPHPSFVGWFLPSTREVSGDGFTATWSVSHLATGLVGDFIRDVEGDVAVDAIQRAVMGVKLIEPVDLYTQSDRAVKYGFLFVLLTFIALLGTELARGLRLHPMQYGMVGVALAMFFLLLLSLAEHLGFAAAYAIAAAACIALLSYYVSGVVSSVAIGYAFAGKLGVLYSLLYGLLSSEDYALLTGSLFVFGVLAALMVLTVRIDWHALGENERRAAEQLVERPSAGDTVA